MRREGLGERDFRRGVSAYPLEVNTLRGYQEITQTGSRFLTLY